MDSKKISEISSSLSSELTAKVEELKEVYLTTIKIQSFIVDRMNDMMKELAVTKETLRTTQVELAGTREHLQLEESMRRTIRTRFRQTVKELRLAKQTILEQQDELAQGKQELIEAKEKESDEKHRKDLCEEELKSVRAFLQQVQENSCSEIETRLEAEKRCRKMKRELENAKDEILEQQQRISDMEKYILDNESERSLTDDSADDNEADDSADDDEVNSKIIEIYTQGGKSPVVRSASGLLPSIPEENPDEIPDYYDAINEYVSSLQISIGSDIVSFDEQGSHEDIRKNPDERIKSSKSKRLNIQTVQSEASAISSDKENAVSHSKLQQPKKKKKLRFTKLYNLAHL